MLVVTTMARIARSEVLDRKDENCVLTECVAAPGRRLAGLLSPLSAATDERRSFIQELIGLFRQHFAVELIAYTFDGNRIKQMLRPKPQLAEVLSAEELARRWLIICPSLRKYKTPLNAPSEEDICRLCNDPDWIERIRSQLSDVAWWNRLLCQRIAQNFNRRDNLSGRFWEGRFRSTLLLDEMSRLTCLASIDVANRSLCAVLVVTDDTQAQPGPPKNDEARMLVAQMNEKEYTNLLDWTHQALAEIPSDTLLENAAKVMLWKRDITASVWLALVMNFEYHFSQIAGRLENMDRHVSRISHRRFFVRPQARRLLRQQSLS